MQTRTIIAKKGSLVPILFFKRAMRKYSPLKCKMQHHFHIKSHRAKHNLLDEKNMITGKIAYNSSYRKRSTENTLAHLSQRLIINPGAVCVNDINAI